MLALVVKITSSSCNVSKHIADTLPQVPEDACENITCALTSRVSVYNQKQGCLLDKLAL